MSSILTPLALELISDIQELREAIESAKDDIASYTSEMDANAADLVSEITKSRTTSDPSVCYAISMKKGNKK